MSPQQNLPILAFESRDDWKSWLAEHHATSGGLWIKIAKKGLGTSSVSYAEALDVALCYGWIDGQKDKFDDASWLQKFTPRKPRSKWSKINRDRAMSLMEKGEMEDAGRLEVEKARLDGRWDAAYDSPSTAEIPDDLRNELEKNERAWEFFTRLDRRNRYAILHRIQDASKPETRARRIEKYVAMLNEQKKIYP